MNNIENKLDLLLRCWLSDKDDLSDRAVDDEKELIKEVNDVLGEKDVE